MKMQIAAMSLLVLPLTSRAYTGAWWMKGDNILVNCEAVPEVFPHLGRISVRGPVLSVEKNGELLQWTLRMSQDSSSKVWDNKQVSLYVALKQSPWDSSHTGTLVFEGAKPEFIPLFCYPQ